jgi:hypothetical protein
MVAIAAVVGVALASALPLPVLQRPEGTSASAQIAQSPAATWDARFFLNGVPGASVLEVYDDGSGPTLYAAGGMVTADDAPASRIARWDGTSWSALGMGLSAPFPGFAEVMALAVFDSGAGAELYVGGYFTRAGILNANGIAKWNGKRWSRVGNGTASAGCRVQALTVFDDGSGPALYAGGLFSSIGGTAARGIARWNGTSWSALGGGFSSYFGNPGSVESLAGFRGKLYAGGEFVMADGQPMNNIASWDGSRWRPLGTGAILEFATLTHVRALEVCKDARGQFLLLGGEFSLLDGTPARNVGRWDGNRFEPIGDGLQGFGVHALAQFDDGRGTALYAGGDMFPPPTFDRMSIARFDGRAWVQVADDLVWEQGNGLVQDIDVVDLGAGKALFAAGGFEFSGERAIHGLAKLRDGEWYPLSDRGRGMEVGLNSSGVTPLSAFEVWDDGTGEALYAGGNFILAGTAAANHVAKWNGEGWAPLGAGITGYSFDDVHELKAFDDGTVSSLYAGGSFFWAGSVDSVSIARWDGVAWWPLGDGLGAPGLGFRPVVDALEVFDDGSGPALYVGGAFSVAGGVSVGSLARWDGTVWSDVGGGVSDTFFSIGQVFAFAVFDDGTGPALYVGGSFDLAGGTAVSHLAKWDGTSWSDVGGGLGSSARVFALEVFDDGTGEALYVGGQFFTAGGMTANNLARWKGTSWRAIGLTGAVHALAVHDDGTEPALYVGGEFTRTIPGNRTLLRIGRWDGTAWSSLGTGLDGSRLPHVEALRSFDHDGVPALYVGGDFDTAGGLRSSNVARWFDSTARRAR